MSVEESPGLTPRLVIMWGAVAVVDTGDVVVIVILVGVCLQ